MASARKCDKCGAYYDKPHNPKFMVCKNQFSIDNTVDLCESCSEKLEMFLTNKDAFVVNVVNAIEQEV